MRGKGGLEWKDKREAILLDELNKIFEYIPFCPKVEVGMGLPREPVQIIGNKEKMNNKYRGFKRLQIGPWLNSVKQKS
jgi:uncharacterized protein YbbK (DUF523 family)